MPFSSQVLRKSGMLLSTAFLLLNALCDVSQAQVPTAIKPDRTLGTKVIQSDNRYDITGGTRPGNGPNLFHSFNRFNVGQGDIARFSGSAGIENILSRVTGGSASHIDGTIRSSIPGANVFLLNPQGVIFGPHASLNISGSFHVSTADAVRLADGKHFSAHLSDVSRLSIAPPAAFGFLGPQAPSAIRVEGGSLQVSPGKTLSVVGGNVDIRGGELRAQSGQIQIVSLGAPGHVPFAGANSIADLRPESFDRLGVIRLTEAANIDVSGDLIISGDLISGTPNGKVTIRSGRFMADNEAGIVAATYAAVDGPKTGIDIKVKENVHLRRLGSLITAALDAGPGSDIRIEAKNVKVSEGGSISSLSLGSGQGGTVRITVADAVILHGTTRKPNGELTQSIISASTRYGNAGAVIIDAGQVTLGVGGHILGTTLGPGRGGTIKIRAQEFVKVTGISQDGELPSTIQAITALSSGDAGGIAIEAKDVIVSRGGKIAASTDITSVGDGGTVQITATRMLRVTGTAQNNARGGILVATLGAGNAGQVRIKAKDVLVSGGAFITGLTDGSGQGGSVDITASGTVRVTGALQPDEPSSIGVQSGNDMLPNAGDAGTIAIKAKHILVTSGGQIAGDTFSSGEGGTVQLTATELVRVTGDAQCDSCPPSSIHVLTLNAKNAGQVLVEARNVFITGGAFISSETQGPGQGGTVHITASETVKVTGASRDNKFLSTIRADSQKELSGKAGDVVVEAKNILITEKGQISSSTSGSGDGGTVTVTATNAVTITNQGSGLFTNTIGQGTGGRIILQARDINLAEGAMISTESTGGGNAGAIHIIAQETFLSSNSTVGAAASQADGGDIQVMAQRMIRLRNSQITTAVGSGEGTGGNITVDPEFVVLQGSQITANAFGGPGGNVRITAGVFLADPASQVSASSTFGIDGQVDIQAPVNNLSGVVAPLSSAFTPATTLLQDRCAARLREGTVSSFIVRERSQRPATYDSVLPSRLYEIPQPQTTRQSAALSRRRAQPAEREPVVRGAAHPAALVFELSCAK